MALGGILGLGLVSLAHFKSNKGALALASALGADLRLETGEAIEPIEGTVFLFFCDLELFFEFVTVQDVWLLGILTIVARCTSNFVEALVGAELTQAPALLKSNIGLLLLPKAGLTMGLTFIARDTMGAPHGGYLFNALLLLTLINMLFFAPSLVKWALTRSGDVQAIEKNP